MEGYAQLLTPKRLELLRDLEIDKASKRIIDREVGITVSAGYKRRLAVKDIVATDRHGKSIHHAIEWADLFRLCISSSAGNVARIFTILRIPGRRCTQRWLGVKLIFQTSIDREIIADLLESSPDSPFQHRARWR